MEVFGLDNKVIEILLDMQKEMKTMQKEMKNMNTEIKNMNIDFKELHTYKK